MLVLGAPAALHAQDAPAPVSFTQRGVPAEATAENGVIARERAFVAGRRAAWERIASAAGVTRTLSDQQIESMVTSIIIEEERTSPTRYTGRITVNFNPGRVRAITGGAAAEFARRQNGGLLDMLTPMLDRNRDGSAIDDMLGMAAQFLARR